MLHRLHARRHESGASAVEFALVLPILMLLLFGIIQYGLHFFAKQSAVSAVREAARRTAVGDLVACGSNPTSTTPPAVASFRRFVYDQVNLGTDNMTITRSFKDATTGSARTPGQAADIMTVTVKFDAFDLGLIPLPGDGTISSSVQSRVENVNSPGPAAC